MTFRAIATLLIGASVLLTCTHTLAQTDATASETLQAAEPAGSEADIAQLIRDLDGNRFSKRQDASRKLKGLGAAAVPALAEAALGDSREASSRSLEILKDHFANGDDKLKEAAASALKKLTESDKAPIARKAKEIMEPKPAPAPRAPGVIPFGPNQFQIQIQAGGAQRVQVRTVNGVKDIDVKENNRSIKIHDDPNNGITVEITEKKDGKDVKSKYEAKDAAELKKKHPEAHKLYEKYRQGGPIQIRGIQAPAIQLQMGNNPFRARPARRLIDSKPIAEQLDKISLQLDEAKKQLDQLKAHPDQTGALQKAIEQLEKAQKTLKETRAKTG